MAAALMRWRSSKKSWMYLPKRDELLLRMVFALPNASKIGFVAIT